MSESRAPRVPTFTSTTSLFFAATYRHHQHQRSNQVSRLDRHTPPPPDTTEATCARTYLIIPRPKLHCSSIHSNSYDAGSYCNTARRHCNCRIAFLLLRLHNTAYVGYQIFEGESDPTRKSKRTKKTEKAGSFERWHSLTTHNSPVRQREKTCSVIVDNDTYIHRTYPT